MQECVIPRILEVFRNDKDLYFQQDGAPPHRDVRAYLDENLPNRCIGCRGSIEYPPRSPDLTPMEFLNEVYGTKPATVNELRAAIKRKCVQIPNEIIRSVCDSIAPRYQQCLDQIGSQFEHLR